MELPIVKPQKRRKMTIASFVVFSALLLVGFQTSAQEGSRPRVRESLQGLPLPPRSEQSDASNSSHSSRLKPAQSSGSLITMAISLGMIVGVLILAGRGMKRFGFQGVPTLSADALELLGRRTIEPKITVHLVKCGSRVLVLGVGPDGVQTLSEINDPEEVEKLVLACQIPSKGEHRYLANGQSAVPLTSKASTIAQRAFVAVAALGLALTMASTADAQSAKPSARARVPVVTDPAPAPEKSKGDPVAPFERGLPFDIELQKLGSPQQIGLSLKMIAMLTVFSLAPSLLMMTTCFVRFAVSLGLLRQALGTQQGLPNQVLTAICMFLTFLVMSPVWQRSYDQGIRPYTSPSEEEGRLDEATAIARTLAPVREFMGKQIDQANNSDAVWMLLDFQRSTADPGLTRQWDEPESYDDVPFSVLAPAYLLSELKTGFLIGFQLFLPFLVIDLVVAMILTSLGLNMMPPSMVSLPFKLLLFVLIDGWFLTVGMLLESVRVV